MPGLFDGLRTSIDGVNLHRVLQEVVGNNIANAANKSYTRQEGRVVSSDPAFDGKHFIGQGASVEQVIRIRDLLLDNQLRATQTNQSNLEIQGKWLGRIQAQMNEPSETGVRAALSNFWESWSQLSVNSESVAARENVLNGAKNLVSLIQDLDTKFEVVKTQINNDLALKVDEFNDLTEEIATLNKDIFELEVGGKAQANDMRDRRDAAIDELSKYGDLFYYQAKNGMYNITVAGHPVIIEDHFEPLQVINNPYDAQQKILKWEFGTRTDHLNFGGEIGGIFDVRDNTLGAYQSSLDAFAATLIDEVNQIYANGVGLEPNTVMESRLGYGAFNVSASTDVLSLVPTGEFGEVHVSFYDTNDKVIRTATVVVDDGDSLDDIATKFNNIPGLIGAVISDPTNDGKLRLEIDNISGDNVMGEVKFAISNNTGGFDSSGFLNLLGFSETTKSAAGGMMTSRDLSELQTILGEANINDVRTKALNFAGSFTINAYETGTETAGFSDGIHVQQLRIDVVSTDTIDTIMAKINALTADHGISMAYNGGTQRLELTTNIGTDVEGNVIVGGGVNAVRLAFFNGYRYPEVATDTPPSNYNGLGDNVDLLATMQMNTLLSGADASDIAVDSNITSSAMVHAGYKIGDDQNGMTLDLNQLQHQIVASSNQYTIGEDFENLVTTIGSAVSKNERLNSNEQVLLESFKAEKDNISGVNLDEELANMMVFQRAYEANARMLSTFNELMEEILRIV